MNKPRKPPQTSWEPIEKWYHGLVGEEGHYYHRQIILPGVMKLLGKPAAVLDLACGTGVLARQLPADTAYTGVDAAPSLIKAAKNQSKNPQHEFQIADITKPLKLKKQDYSHATIILAVQNLEFPDQAFLNAHKHLKPGGVLILVLNHPCFRIPRQSSWQVDENKKIQYRRIDRYYTPMKIPIHAHPSQGAESQSSLTFHNPLSSYSQMLHKAGFCIDWIEEWCSDKQSTGKAAKMENRSREEFPLFMAIRAVKNETLTNDK